MRTLDIRRYSEYNVFTMRSKIIRIGNSKGVRIPKPLLEEAKLVDEAEITLEDGVIVIRPVQRVMTEDMAWSYLAFDKDWDNPDEDAAWQHLQ